MIPVIGLRSGRRKGCPDMLRHVPNMRAGDIPDSVLWRSELHKPHEEHHLGGSTGEDCRLWRDCC